MNHTSSDRGARDLARGFTLLEIMVVIAIIGLITAAIGTAVVKHFKEGQVASTRQLIRNIAQQALTYRLNHGECPPSLEALREERYLTKAQLVDAWKKPIVYACPSTHEDEDVDIHSFGPDGIDGTKDDLVSWGE